MGSTSRLARLKAIKKKTTKGLFTANDAEGSRRKIPHAYDRNAKEIGRLTFELFKDIHVEWAAIIRPQLQDILDHFFYKGRPSKARIRLLQCLQRYDVGALVQGIRDFHEKLLFSSIRDQLTVFAFLSFIKKSEVDREKRPKLAKNYYVYTVKRFVGDTTVADVDLDLGS